MVGVIDALLAEEQRRKDAGEAGWMIPMRPDHGHLLADDIGKARINPGYSLIRERLKGLAELRGVMRATGAINAGGGCTDVVRRGSRARGVQNAVRALSAG